MRYNVVVIGGGISGISIAYFLAEKGVERVVVIESNYLGGGSTFKCAGGIRASFTSREHVVLMKKSIELWGELAEKYGFPYKRSGYLWLIEREKDYIKFERIRDFHNKLGLETRFVDQDFVKDVAPAVDTSRLVAALYDPLAGKTSPFKSLHALYLASKKNGVEYRVGERVISILAGKGTIVGVRIGKEDIKSEFVVVAAGAWSKELLKTVNVDIPLQPVPHHAAITEEYGRAFDPLLVDVSTGAYTVQTSHGHVLMGVEIEEEPGATPVVRSDFLSKLVKVWSKWLPWLMDSNILRYWVGYYVMSPDHHPILGPVEGIEGLYVATGFSGHGFMMGPVVGDEISEWIINGMPSINETKNLTLSRFKEGRLIYEQAVIG